MSRWFGDRICAASAGEDERKGARNSVVTAACARMLLDRTRYRARRCAPPNWSGFEVLTELNGEGLEHAQIGFLVDSISFMFCDFASGVQEHESKQKMAQEERKLPGQFTPVAFIPQTPARQWSGLTSPTCTSPTWTKLSQTSSPLITLFGIKIYRLFPNLSMYFFLPY